MVVEGLEVVGGWRIVEGLEDCRWERYRNLEPCQGHPDAGRAQMKPARGTRARRLQRSGKNKDKAPVFLVAVLVSLSFDEIVSIGRKRFFHQQIFRRYFFTWCVPDAEFRTTKKHWQDWKKDRNDRTSARFVGLHALWRELRDAFPAKSPAAVLSARRAQIPSPG